MTKFQVSEKRYVVVKKNEIKLFEDGTSKAATFIFSRWAQFVENFAEIDGAVAKLVSGETDVKLQLHIGGAWFVSVTSGFRCIDVRKFYVAPGGETKATRTGIAIRLSEWDRVKDIASELKEKNKKIADAQPCWTNADHYNQDGAIACRDCNPFGNWFASKCDGIGEVDVGEPKVTITNNNVDQEGAIACSEFGNWFSVTI